MAGIRWNVDGGEGMSKQCLMVQGTASDAGKSFLVAGLCRYYANRGVRVAPFKSQNMALNSAVTADGAEIGRAQALQAEAAKTPALSLMNPILLKPRDDMVSQLIIRGQAVGDVTPKEYQEFAQAEGKKIVYDAFCQLRELYDLVILEGGGNPAEPNLAHYDIVNMGMARMINAPVLLVSDIDRGGVFASLVGTLALLPEGDRQLIKALVINRFRGDLEILKPGLTFLEERTRLPVAGVLPYLTDIRLPEEDSMAARRQHQRRKEGLQLAVVRLPRISNFTDFDALADTHGAEVYFAAHPDELIGADAVLLPGTRNSIEDLRWLREKGLEATILALQQSGVPVVGICGGYQMLGRLLHDPEGLEAAPGSTPGMNLLPCETVFKPGKTVRRATGHVLSLSWAPGATLTGYEIHSGETTVDDIKTVFASLKRQPDQLLVMDGCASEDGLVLGSYLHGLFDDPSFAQAFLAFVAAQAQKRGKSAAPLAPAVHAADPLDQVAQMLAENLQMELVQGIIQGKSPVNA